MHEKVQSTIVGRDCEKHSIELEYIVPDSGKKAAVRVCERNMGGGGYCLNGRAFRRLQDLNLQDRIELEVSKEEKERPRNYVVAVFAQENREVIYSKKYFNFSDCPVIPTEPNTKALHLNTTESNTLPSLDMVQNTSFFSHADDVETYGTASGQLVTAANNSEPIGTSAPIVLSLTPISLAIIIAAIILSLFLLIGSLCWRRNKQEKSKTVLTPPESNDHIELVELLSQKTVTVYVVFVQECHPLHLNVVIAFANFLQEGLGFRVIFELWEKQKAADNYTRWMENSMSAADKIIVIWSQEASRKIQSCTEDSFCRPDTFSPVLEHIRSDIFNFKNVKKYNFVFFNYSNNDGIPDEVLDRKKFRSFKLMRDFEDLYFNLIDHEKHHPGQCIKSSKIDPRTYFNPNVNPAGYVLKQAIDKAEAEFKKKMVVGDKISETELNDASIAIEENFVSSETPTSSNRENIIETQSIVSETECFNSKRLSLVSLAKVEPDEDPLFLLHNVNFLTMLNSAKN